MLATDKREALCAIVLGKVEHHLASLQELISNPHTLCYAAELSPALSLFEAK